LHHIRNNPLDRHSAMISFWVLTRASSAPQTYKKSK
jgi:hypothetical protein